METKRFVDILRATSNDYSSLEEAYARRAGAPLVNAPLETIGQLPQPITTSASVIIKARNAADTLDRCLLAIEQSSFNRNYPDLLEVVVVDDGSTDGTWELLRSLRLDLRVLAVRQGPHGRAHAINAAISVASGDVIIACDADMILNVFTLEEMVKRHQMLDKVLLLGFRTNISPHDTRISPSSLAEALPEMAPNFYGDYRVTMNWAGHPYHGWPTNICAATDHLKRLGNAKRIWLPDGGSYDLPITVFGALFSIRRRELEAMQGVDERFSGWGYEDSITGAYAAALGNHIIPVYSATGRHIEHPIRSSSQWEEASINRQLYQEIQRSPFHLGASRRLEQANKRIYDHVQHVPRRQLDPLPDRAYQTIQRVLDDPYQVGEYFYHLGRYIDAANAYARIPDGHEQAQWASYHQGKALRSARDNEAAIDCLTRACAALPGRAQPRVELALALAAAERLDEGRAMLSQAKQCGERNRLLAYVCHPPHRHRRRGLKFAAQGDYHLALFDFEAALLHGPATPQLRARYEECLQLSKATVQATSY